MGDFWDATQELMIELERIRLEIKDLVQVIREVTK